VKLSQLHLWRKRMLSCLKVEIGGKVVVDSPKKTKVHVAWDETALDNEDRLALRAFEDSYPKDQEQDANAEKSSVEEADTEDDEQCEGDDDDDDDVGLPNAVVMKYCSELAKYGYADLNMLQKISSAEWSNLSQNVGIAPEHELHLRKALGIRTHQAKTSSSRKLVESPNRRRLPTEQAMLKTSPDESSGRCLDGRQCEVRLSEELPGLEDDLLALVNHGSFSDACNNDEESDEAVDRPTSKTLSIPTAISSAPSSETPSAFPRRSEDWTEYAGRLAQSAAVSDRS
jgi:hypothetical protein